MQFSAFSTGGCVIHKVTGNFSGKVSAWFDAEGVLLSAEQILPNGKERPVKRAGPMWRDIISTTKGLVRRHVWEFPMLALFDTFPKGLRITTLSGEGVGAEHVYHPDNKAALLEQFAGCNVAAYGQFNRLPLSIGMLEKISGALVLRLSPEAREAFRDEAAIMEHERGCCISAPNARRRELAWLLRPSGALMIDGNSNFYSIVSL